MTAERVERRTSALRLVVGYAGGEGGRDTIAFVNHWAVASGDSATVVSVRSQGDSVDPEGLLTEARALTAAEVDASFTSPTAGSAAQALSELAEPAGTSTVLVLGSSPGHLMLRTFPGSTAERVLHGAAAPVVIVPWGYAELPRNPLARVAVGFIDTRDGHAALDWAIRLTDRLGGSLIVVSAVPDTRLSGFGEPAGFREGAREEFGRFLDEAVSRAATRLGGRVEGLLVEAPPVEVLTEMSPDDVDLLVIGSRGYGPLRRVLLGGVSSRVVRHARVPTLVAPRAGGAGEQSSG